MASKNGIARKGMGREARRTGSDWCSPSFSTNAAGARRSRSRPSRSTTTRRACAAMSGSCVTMMTVCPWSARLSNTRMISSDVVRVEVTRRLVGEEDGRIVHERARDGDALPLTARELVRPVVHALAELHALERFLGAALALVARARRRRRAAARRCAARVARGRRLNVWKTNPISLFRTRASASSRHLRDLLCRSASTRRRSACRGSR